MIKSIAAVCIFLVWTVTDLRGQRSIEDLARVIQKRPEIDGPSRADRKRLSDYIQANIQCHDAPMLLKMLGDPRYVHLSSDIYYMLARIAAVNPECYSVEELIGAIERTTTGRSFADRLSTFYSGFNTVAIVGGKRAEEYLSMRATEAFWSAVQLGTLDEGQSEREARTAAREAALFGIASFKEPRATEMIGELAKSEDFQSENGRKLISAALKQAEVFASSRLRRESGGK